MTTHQRPDPGDVVISVSDLRMRYGSRDALAGVSFEVYRGELFAVLGPNGAGKTSTLEILEGYRRRTGGQVSVLGADPWKAGRPWRSRIGVMLQESAPEADLKVTDCLRLYGGYYANPHPIDELLELTGLDDQASTRVARLSGGQKRRLDLALALTGRPQLLFLDEPTTGFDPAARHEAWQTIAMLKEGGTTIVLTTHYLEEAERLADRVAVIAAGTLVSLGSPTGLPGLDSRAASTRITFALPAGVRADDLPLPVRTAIVGTIDGRVTLTAAGSALPLLRTLAEWAGLSGHDLADLEVRRPTLEDAYLELTNHESPAKP